MTLSRRPDPFSGLLSLHSHIDDMFNSFLTAPGAVGQTPTMDIYTEDDKNLVAEVHAPGFTKDDIEIHVNNGVLELKGEKHEKQEGKDKKRSYMVRESHASFYRSIALPKHADADRVAASFDDGVLRVTVPFKELPAPKRIAIGEGKKK